MPVATIIAALITRVIFTAPFTLLSPQSRRTIEQLETGVFVGGTWRLTPPAMDYPRSNHMKVGNGTMGKQSPQLLWAGLKRAISNWWEGTYVPYKNHSDSVVFVGGQFERHWTAMWVRSIWHYFQEHHRWIIATTVALAMVLVVAFK